MMVGLGLALYEREEKIEEIVEHIDKLLSLEPSSPSNQATKRACEDILRTMKASLLIRMGRYDGKSHLSVLLLPHY